LVKRIECNKFFSLINEKKLDPKLEKKFRVDRAMTIILQYKEDNNFGRDCTSQSIYIVSQISIFLAHQQIFVEVFTLSDNFIFAKLKFIQVENSQQFHHLLSQFEFTP